MAGTESEASSSEKKPESAEEQDYAWKRELPAKYLSESIPWNDGIFLPKGASKQHVDHYRTLYRKYFRQIHQSDGFDSDVYPGDAKAAVYVPYLDFEKENDLLMELANHAIEENNKRETSVHKLKLAYIEKVNFLSTECREFFITVKVENLTLITPLETFQIHAYKGPQGENVVRLCRKKILA